ncbi:MAG: hypothetical protein FWF41_00255 [Betaproteobacteria bacterium]|nr:hypothetical protein [Betaproteobacteria bacterium]
MKITRQTFDAIKKTGIVLGLICFFGSVALVFWRNNGWYFLGGCLLGWFINYPLIRGYLERKVK